MPYVLMCLRLRLTELDHDLSIVPCRAGPAFRTETRFTVKYF